MPVGRSESTASERAHREEFLTSRKQLGIDELCEFVNMLNRISGGGTPHKEQLRMLDFEWSSGMFLLWARFVRSIASEVAALAVHPVPSLIAGSDARGNTRST